MSSLAPLVERAIESRGALLARLDDEGTTCVRLFHGAVEGSPGLTVDRYGPVLLVQTWGRDLAPDESEAIVRIAHRMVSDDLVPAFVERDPRRARDASAPDPDPRLEAPFGFELGVKYDVRPFHRGLDPLLFLDLRVARRWIASHAHGKSLLNLFAYTCGVGVVASAYGAAHAWNVDFAESALAVGRANAAANGADESSFRTIHENVIPVLRQLAGLPVKGRGRRREYARFDARAFDIVVLDPPRWAKTPFGAIDVVHDYPSLVKPAMRTVAPHGTLLVTNHVPAVPIEDFERMIRRTAEKDGREILSIERLIPEADFPSPDGRHPLKLLVVTLG